MPPERALSLLRGEIWRKKHPCGRFGKPPAANQKKGLFCGDLPFWPGQNVFTLRIVIIDKFSCKNHFIIDILDNAV